MESQEKRNFDSASVEQFFASDFDVEAYSRAIIDGGKAVADELQQLKFNMDELDRQLKSQVVLQFFANCPCFFGNLKKNKFRF